MFSLVVVVIFTILLVEGGQLILWVLQSGKSNSCLHAYVGFLVPCSFDEVGFEADVFVVAANEGAHQVSQAYGE